MKIVIINGPNLNLLGVREPEKYGVVRFEDYLNGLKARYVDCDIEYYQSNVEGEIIDKLHEVGFATWNVRLASAIADDCIVMFSTDQCSLLIVIAFLIAK